MGTERHYRPGSFYRICDRTGFAKRAEQTRKQWNNIIVWNDVWEIRQPQDFVRGISDDQTVPQARPRAVDAYDGPLHTFIIVAANIGDLIINVNETARMYAGDQISLALDNGAVLETIIVKVLSQSQLQLMVQLPWTAAVNNDLTNITAYSPPNEGVNSFGQPE